NEAINAFKNADLFKNSLLDRAKIEFKNVDYIFSEIKKIEEKEKKATNYSNWVNTNALIIPYVDSNNEEQKKIFEFRYKLVNSVEDSNLRLVIPLNKDIVLCKNNKNE